MDSTVFMSVIHQSFLTPIAIMERLTNTQCSILELKLWTINAIKSELRYQITLTVGF